MSRLVTVAATQMTCDWNIQGNVDRAEQLVREAAGRGAQIILIQELFETPYFCIEQNHKHLDPATTMKENNTIKRFSSLAITDWNVNRIFRTTPTWISDDF